MPSCCKQIKNFVRFGRELHGEIGKWVDALNEREKSDRVRMALEFLSVHERHMEEALARFETTSHSGILEAWLEYSSNLDVQAVMERCTLSEHPTADEIVDATFCFEKVLVELYRELAAKANDRNAKELFGNLLALEEKEKIQVARALMELADL